jgi:hypothetical protein
MVEITHRDVDRGSFEVGSRTVSLSETETRIEVIWGNGGWTWTYRRPKSVAMGDDPDTTVRLRDHSMLAKIAFVLVTIALLTRRG